MNCGTCLPACSVATLLPTHHSLTHSLTILYVQVPCLILPLASVTFAMRISSSLTREVSGVGRILLDVCCCVSYLPHHVDIPAGLLSMVTSGIHTNGSQFYISLGPCPVSLHVCHVCACVCMYACVCVCMCVRCIEMKFS